MKRMKKVAQYIGKILFVVLFGPIILVKAIMDPALRMMIALVYALLNDSEATDNVIKQVLEKVD